MSKTKLVSIEGKREEEVYINPDSLQALTDVAEWIKEIGCSEISITVMSGCMTYSEVFHTYQATDAMLGALERYKQRYARELDSEYWEEDECE